MEVFVLSKKIFWIIGLVAVCIIGIIVLTDVSEKSVVLDYEGQPFLGEESAPVEIVEFGDYKCPSCKDFNDNLLPIIYKELVETGKAKLYFMNYSFIAADSTTAAQFAESVYQELGDEKFWEFHELLFENQQPDAEQINYFTEEFLKELLADVASSEEVEKVLSAYQNHEGEAALKKDMKMADSLKVSSTPTIFIGGKEFKGRTMNDFTKMVEEAAADGK
ncbi:thioredoxin domain-containing protein [Sporosarcina sp. Sa3CUA8]|uniref:Thioredoxin domain-containing protein n=1 Tax=Sporosarcina gallistercoris TaxID=2762245 RepID=A0ABR8PKU3_9BACL|nr:thioredoxin domain-containing protein [Sporosarcina gallistercoris]